MKKIIVCCNAGVTTTLLVQKLQYDAIEKGLDYEFVAYPIAQAIEHLGEADAVLLSPQVAFALPNIKEGTEKPVTVIDEDAYARVDVSKIVDDIAGLFA